MLQQLRGPCVLDIIVRRISRAQDLQNYLYFEDFKFIPPPLDPLRNYTAGETRGGTDRTDVKSLHILQPEGPSFLVRGHFVEWQKWNFPIGFPPWEGLVLCSAAYVDNNQGRRSVAHRLSFVEMVVPYGDPDEPRYWKNAFEAGEDGLAKNAHSLKKVETIENCVCLHEEDYGILRKHQDWRTGLAEVRRSRRLTVSFIYTVANYDYGFYWHFYQVVEVNVKAEELGIHNVHNNAFYAEGDHKIRTASNAQFPFLSARHWMDSIC